LQPLDVNQETLREARSQKRKATSPTPQEEELDQEIRDLEAIHQQVQRKKDKMLRLADLQKKIDEAAEEMRHLTQDDQDRRPQRRELRRYIETILTTTMNGMMISNMEILLLMMLLLCQQNCRLPHGPHHTSYPSSPCMTGTQIRSCF
jgi:phosphoglycerate dehydrogenase-like enzyme